MKRKAFSILLVCEAALCMLTYLARGALPWVFTAAMAFPFEQIGLGLRALSLSGRVGNALAVALYAAVCLSPAIALPALKRKRGLLPEDTLLAILSGALFVVLYLMINPGLLGGYAGGLVAGSVGKAALGGMTYSILVGYAILRLARLFFAADTRALQRYLAALLCVLNALFVYLAFGASFGALLDSIGALRAGNAGNEHALGASYAFLALRYLVGALPYALNILVVFSALRLLDELDADRYSEATVAAAGKLSRLCGLVLITIALSNAGFNLLQLALIKSLAIVNGSVSIPLFSLAVALAALLLSRYIAENKRLKDDNDMFI